MKWLYVVVVSLLLAGCACTERPAHSLEAERDIEQVVAPMLREYIAADAALTENDRQAFGTLLDAWDFRLDEEEAANAE